MEVKDIFRINPLISIIVPMYNAEKTLGETIETVLKQTYTNWELILVDDCSIDDTLGVCGLYREKDDRIIILKMDINSGPGAATKYGVENAHGGFIAFIDSDDLWVNNKLELQIAYMIENNYEFICSDYDQIDELGNSRNRVIKCKPCAGIRQIVRTCPIGSSTVVLTKQLIDKVHIPVIRKDNDLTLWIEIMKQYPYVYGMNIVLMHYRVWAQSISYKKYTKLKYHYIAYKDYLRVSRPIACLLVLRYCLVKILRIK